MIDDCVSWKYHISYICSRISRNIGIISKLRHYLSIKQLKQIYYNLIYPYITYAILAWGSTYVSSLQKVQVKQNHVARLIFFANIHGKDTESALPHSRPQRPRSFWSAPRIATSGPVQRHSIFEWLWKHNRLRPEPIRFVRLDSEHAQSDGKSVNRGLPVLDQAKGRDSWCWPKGVRPLGTRMTLPLLNLLNMLTVNNIYSLHILKFAHLWHKGLLPDVFCNTFQYTSEVHSYNTRYATQKNLYKPHVRTNTGKQMISFKATDLWKSIPQNL